MSAEEAVEEALRDSGLEDMAEPSEILAALKATGYTVVELADDETVEDYGLYVSRAPHFGLPVGEEHDAGSKFRSIDETRRYASALLAVANAAEAAEVPA